ncbi:MAG TPA: GAF domain-containing sensor histidine kinase [Leeuwenhoekiella sp.]|nr:GAF domain-containing sensor histidine kinase [Leeuwenhoekiella sp.]
MPTAELPSNETERIRTLNKLGILDSAADDDYDDITELAGLICGVPVALITFVDRERQWFKSKRGMALCETSRDSSFCAHAILEPSNILEVPDARKDPRFIDNPLTEIDKPVIFYAGIPLKAENGMPLGSLCVIDHRPNSLNDDQKRALKKLGRQVEKLFLLRTANSELRDVKESLEKHNALLKEFAGTVSHDLKMPLANLIITSDILKKEYRILMDDRGREYLGYLKKSSLSLSDYITKILDHYESTSYERDDTEHFYINDLLEDVIDLLNIKDDCEINLPKKNMEVVCNATALKQVFINLIGNSLKYNDKVRTIINIRSIARDGLYEFKIRDNGRGIEMEKLETVFGLFTIGGHLDKNGEKGHGIGLNTVQKIVDGLGGTITLSSEIYKYTEFVFTVKRG